MKPCPLCETKLQDRQTTCHQCGFIFKQSKTAPQKKQPAQVPTVKKNIPLEILRLGFVMAMMGALGVIFSLMTANMINNVGITKFFFLGSSWMALIGMILCMVAWIGIALSAPQGKQ